MGPKRRQEERVALLILFPSHLSFYLMSQATLSFLNQASRPIPGTKGILNPTALKQDLLGLGVEVQVEKRSAHYEVDCDSTLGGCGLRPLPIKKGLQVPGLMLITGTIKQFPPSMALGMRGPWSPPCSFKSTTEVSNQSLSLKPGNADLQSLSGNVTFCALPVLLQLKSEESSPRL